SSALEASRTETIAEVARAIRRGPHRDRVADLVIDAIARFAPGCVAAMLLVIRGTTAIGWKAFHRSGGAAPAIAVPLDRPGLVPDVIVRAPPARGAARELGAIDLLVLRALGEPEGELGVVPITVAGKVMCLIALATGRDAELTHVETIATAAGTAFGRLMRDA